MVEEDGTEDIDETAFVPQKTEQKGKLLIEPMVKPSWQSKDYSALAEQMISLVEKSTGMPEVTSGVSHPKLLVLDKQNWRPHHNILAKGNQGSGFS